MRLSIFPLAKAHPTSKEEKRVESFKVSSPNLPITVEFNNDEDLLQFVTSNAWSPFTFSGTRHADNFISTDLLVYDIDKGLSIPQAEAIVKAANLACLCLPSPSHTEEAHRFRIILPLAYSISSSEVYESTWKTGAALFGAVDPQCSDTARYYFGSTTDDGFWNEGTLFVPVAKTEQKEMEHAPHKQIMLAVGADVEEIILQIYGEKRTFVSEAVDFFVRNAHTGFPGEWTNSLNAFCFSLSLSEVPDDVILTVCEQLSPGPLTKSDLYQINRAISDAKKV